jgi:2-polyprenyl-6-methoxyphenol hydroxylase-like FAD-dependent oxidoreductase
VLIVGAGQSGLLLAGLLQTQGCEVTVVSNRSPVTVATGRILSTQVMFGPASAVERSADLEYWQNSAPPIRDLEYTLADASGEPVLTWSGGLAQPAYSIDHRTKFSRWMQVFSERQGHLEIGPQTVATVIKRCRVEDYDLVVIATGGGSTLAKLFPQDPRVPTSEPQRALSAIYLHNVDFGDESGQFTSVPGRGEIVTTPALTGTTPCHTMLVEALPGGPWDRFADLADDPQAHLSAMMDLLSHYAPEVYRRYHRGILTDPGARLVGAVTPTVRYPVATLAGQSVVGLGDTVCWMDPLGAQGANTAARCAARFATAIIESGDQPLDKEWMLRTTQECWRSIVGPALTWTNFLLYPTTQAQQAIAAAAQDQATANNLVAAFADPGVITSLV